MGRSFFHKFAQCTLPLNDLTTGAGSSSITGLDIDWGDGSSHSVYTSFPSESPTHVYQGAASA
jgi:hypothetical protein